MRSSSPSPFPLNIRKSDPEYLLGVKPGKYTNPNKALGLLFGFGATLGVFTSLWFFPSDLKETRLVAMFLDRGTMPYLTVLAFSWGMALILLKQLKLKAQCRALRFMVDVELPKYRITPESAPDWIVWLDKSVDNPHGFLLIQRLRCVLATLASMREVSVLPGVLSTHTESDEVQVDESYSFVAILLVITPLLGFIGTVLGLSQSIGGFGKTMEATNGDMALLIDSLKHVTGGLSVAFDTTLLALICTLILQLYFALVKSKETQFLEDCGSFCREEFLPHIALTERTHHIPDQT